jgi:hypothetical protein
LVGRPPRRGGRRGGLSSSSFAPASGFGSRSALPSSLSAAAGGSGSTSPFRRPVDVVESSASASSRSSTEDEAVRATDGDASLSRLSVHHLSFSGSFLCRLCGLRKLTRTAHFSALQLPQLGCRKGLPHRPLCLVPRPHPAPLRPAVVPPSATDQPRHACTDMGD